MIARLNPYPSHQSSGLPWVGDVPDHWDLVPNRGLVRKRKVLVGQRHSDYRLLSLTKQGVIVRDISTGKGKFSSDIGSSQEVRKGDLVFCFFDVPETPRTVGLSSHDGMITGAYTVLEMVEASKAQYFELFYRAMDDRKLLSPLYSGLRNTIPLERFMGAKTPQPPPEEMAAIVRFLNYANARLEKAIRAKQNVVLLLNEQKDAIIHRAVTRGFDVDVPLKPSGVDWLGNIPQHWKVSRIKYLLREVDERSTTGAEPLLSMRMHHGLVLFSEHFSRPPQAASLVGFKIVRPGQFVVNRMQAGNGLIFASRLTGLVSPDYAVLDPIGDANVEFLGELFRSRTVRAKFRAESKGLGTGTSGFLRLYSDRMGGIHVALPPRDEQSAIMARLDSELFGLNSTISRLEREIELLREYRTRLVADVVTGKLDVREVAARLPEESMPEEAAVGDDEFIEGDESDDVEAAA
ncbi:restriction endonuclease subunit S [Bradyrhizobium sp. CCGB01]|uniref:restriction endonuclease subunit S n=1 Tax=Bradyrhizobium sp. CCGB01 TaxID=2949634 RepID=UPI0020B31875|nr:restriction endonuclease subunit S [Bradyrhizobium sp. CCGB01]MCP3404070.1 restriction endonuclease subunit S [Bradyrhizobium sp. CCGB01]